MLVKFTPAQFDAENESEAGNRFAEQFEGFIEVQIPPYHERLRLPKEIGLAVVGEGNVEDAKKDVSKALQQLDLLANCAERIQKYVKGVELKDIKAGVELKSVEDFYSYPDAGGMVTALCSKFILGFLGKKN
jgi:hypothetical protein